MRPPSKTEAQGYDIVVWSDKDGDIVCRAFTPAGDKALRAFVNKYHRGDLVQIYMPPEKFEAELPEGITVGLLNPKSKKVVPMNAVRLH